MTPSSRNQIRIVAASLLVGAAVVASCACGALGWKLSRDGRTLSTERQATAQERAEFERDRQIRQTREDGRRAAESLVVVLTSIDPYNIDANFAEVLEQSTGELKDEFAKASVRLRQLLVDNHAIASGRVVASAVQSDTADMPDKKVVVLLAVDQTITNNQRPDPRVDKSRMKVTMELVDGRWLGGKLEYV
ncbi:Mce protein [Mycobacteroides sp. LB1]|uniref:Mce protein n=1 Tax=Mycobacteroides sp. LB1 TaxID=2750814 RepID=UPI0015DFC65A|nr:Mce protein [Mycobacteroides sp. LB1]